MRLVTILLVEVLNPLYRDFARAIYVSYRLYTDACSLPVTIDTCGRIVIGTFHRGSPGVPTFVAGASIGGTYEKRLLVRENSAWWRALLPHCFHLSRSSYQDSGS